MRLVIEAADFRRLSKSTQRELIETFAGDSLAARRLPRPRETAKRASYDWRRPVDLSHDLTIRLIHGLSENHRKRLAVFARRHGRASMKQLLKATGDADARVLSYFQSVVTRKLRRIIGDQEKQALLIAWDYESTRWNREHTKILDGVYYVTDKSAAQLRAYFGMD